MPIFSKPNSIVYLRRSGLIVAGKKITPARMAFSPDHVENLEVVDATGFIDILRTFFTDHELKGKHVLMVLDSSVVFTKIQSLSTDQKPAAVIDAFIDVIPLAEGQRACVRIAGQSEVSLYATNSVLYETVAEALDEAGVARLLAITPAEAYPSEGGKQQLAAAVQQYVNDTSVYILCRRY